jgi:D-sedoheptulose 7-phosphate isomerase
MIVFTNGCFDLIHPGHIDLLTKARAMGSRLVVGLNSDNSVRAIKGAGRPIQDQEARKTVLLALKPVDEVVIFNELTPERIITEIRPDVLVKGGDWKPGEIVGADLVESYGGKVRSIPLLEGYSTSSMVERGHRSLPESVPSDDLVKRSIDEHLDVFSGLISACGEQINASAVLIQEALAKGGKILTCGNGGSAADSQHIAAELVGRYESERRALPAIALTTDTSALTALANDYDFEHIFSRQVDALAASGDCLIAISTSGNSPNVLRAVMKAREKGCRVVGMTGSGGKKLAGLCDACVMVPSARTSRIQEAHIAIAHIWCEMVEASVMKK